MNPPAEHQLAEYVVVQRAGQMKAGKLPFQGGDKLKARARNSRGHETKAGKLPFQGGDKLGHEIRGGTKRKLVNYRFKGEIAGAQNSRGS